MEDKKVKKESKDKTQKNLEAFQDVAADIINALYYDGKETVIGESLIPASNSLKEFLLNKEADPERVASIDEMGLHVYEMRHLPKKVRERF